MPLHAGIDFGTSNSGVAVFAGLRSPLNGLYGLGLWEEVTPRHLDQASDLFASGSLGTRQAEVLSFTIMNH